MSAGRRWVLAGLILFPLCFIFVLQTATYSFSSQGMLPHSEILRNGWAIFSCDPPFDSQLVLTDGVEAMCGREGGRRVLIARFEEAAGEGAGQEGKTNPIRVRFPALFNERFEGRVIEVVFEAACVGCLDASHGVFRTNVNGNSGRREFQISEDFGSFSFRYRIQGFGGSQVAAPTVEIFAPNVGAVIKVKSVVLREVS